MRAVIACLLIASVAFAAHDTVQPVVEDNGLTMAELEQIHQLEQSNWGSIFLGLAELQTSSEGPIQKLVQTLDDLLKELKKSKHDENNRYRQKQGTHESNVLNLNNQINAAKAEINNNKIKIERVLKPRKKQAKLDIVADTKTIASKRKQIADSNARRKEEHKAFKERVAQHNQAIKAVDECLQLVANLKAGKASFVEVRKASMSIRRLEESVKGIDSIEMPLVEALIALVDSQNFANAESLNKVQSLLTSFRGRLVKSLELEKSNEAAAKAAHQKRIATLNKEIADLQANIRKNTKVIADTKLAIENCNNQIMIKTSELIDLTGKLDAENENWRKETQIHKDIIDEINKELGVVKQCRILFATHQFGAYAKKRIH